MAIHSLGQEDPLAQKMTTHSSILPWEIPWTEEPGGLQVHGVEKSWTLLSDLVCTHTLNRFLTKEDIQRADKYMKICSTSYVIVLSRSVVSNSLRHHRLQPARLLCPWDSPDKNTGEGCHAVLQGFFLTQGSNPGVLHCRQILYCLSHQGSPYHEILLSNYSY